MQKRVYFLMEVLWGWLWTPFLVTGIVAYLFTRVSLSSGLECFLTAALLFISFGLSTSVLEWSRPIDNRFATSLEVAEDNRMYE